MAVTLNETKGISPLEVSETIRRVAIEHLPKIISVNSPTDLADQTDYKKSPRLELLA